MEKEIKGYRIDTCFGPGGCPNRAHFAGRLIGEIESLLAPKNLLTHLKKRVEGKLKIHHEFRISLADCPNACSQPQIKDIGIIGACAPAVTENPCSSCLACKDICKEDAIELTEKERPEIDRALCLRCGQCIEVCTTDTLAAGEKGFRVLLGGKLGRHPKLARELPGIFSEEEVLEIVEACVDFYLENSRHGERFAELLKDSDFEDFCRKFAKETEV